MVFAVLEAASDSDIGANLRGPFPAEVNLSPTAVTPLGLDGLRANRRQFRLKLLNRAHFVSHANTLTVGYPNVKGLRENNNPFLSPLFTRAIHPTQKKFHAPASESTSTFDPRYILAGFGYRRRCP